MPAAVECARTEEACSARLGDVRGHVREQARASIRPISAARSMKPYFPLIDNSPDSSRREFERRFQRPVSATWKRFQICIACAVLTTSGSGEPLTTNIECERQMIGVCLPSFSVVCGQPEDVILPPIADRNKHPFLPVLCMCRFR